jgi:predicted phosphoribosyltransferase
MGSAEIALRNTGQGFPNRRVAGVALARHLTGYARRPDLIVLAVPRGGVPVAYEVARALDAPLDAFVVRKLGLPRHAELAMGAVASGGIVVLNHELIRSLGIPDSEVARVLKGEQLELNRREHRYRDDRPPPRVTGKTVILVDDGLATGASMLAAVAALRQNHPSRLIVAVPIGAPDTCEALREHADEVVCAVTPEPFYGVGAWYQDFGQTTDDEVRTLLRQADHERAVAHGAPANRIERAAMNFRPPNGEVKAN